MLLFYADDHGLWGHIPGRRCVPATATRRVPPREPRRAAESERALVNDDRRIKLARHEPNAIDRVAGVIDDELPSVRLLEDMATDPVGKFNCGYGDGRGVGGHEQ